MARDELTRPTWWEPWIPIRCGRCREPLLPGKVSLSWAHCECAGAGPARGHHVLYCARGSCHWHIWPPEHVQGEETPEPPRA